MHHLKRLPIPLLILTLSTLHIIESLNYFRATQLSTQNTIPALTQATHLAPRNAEWRGQLALLDPQNAPFLLNSALNLDPNNTLLRIEQGVNYEVANNPTAAEAAYLEAARRDHQYLPRWTLAAFYFRQNNLPKFQLYTRQALDMAYGDALPLVQMAGKLGMSIDEIRRTLLPDRAPVYQAFIDHSLSLGSLQEAATAAQHLIAIGKPTRDRDTILSTIGALFRSNLTSASVALWNQTAQSHWIPNLALNPTSGPLVSNPGFNFEFLPAAYDWNQNPTDGVVFWRLGNGRGYQIELSGRQPENCTLATLPLPLLPSHEYQLHINETTEIPPNSGLAWHLGTNTFDAAKEVDAPIQSEPTYLTLQYNRALGTKRLEGTLTILRVTIGSPAASLRRGADTRVCCLDTRVEETRLPVAQVPHA